MSFLDQLKRRHVVRVALLYVVAAWLVLQIADVLLPNLGAPEWAFRLVLALLALFFLPVLVFAWVYELTPEGLVRDRGDAPRRPGAGRRMNLLIVVLLVLAIGGLIYDRMVPEAPVTGGKASAELGAATGAGDPGEGSVADPSPSIAVLPFATRSDDRQDAYFSAGMHDDLLTQLAKIDGLKVISRTSVMQYADGSRSMREIAEELGVANVLEGSVQRAGDRVRVNAQLIEAATDRHLWAETYDEEMTASNVFLIQSRLAASIAAALTTELASDVQRRIERQPTDNLEAWDLFLKGRYLLDKEQSLANLEGAVEFLRAAIDEDKTYAAAWAGLAQAIGELVTWQYWPEAALAEAWDAADRAVLLDPELADGYFARGDLMKIARRWESGEAAFLKGLELSPGDADGRSRYSDLLRDTGRAAASVEEARRAVELDPRLVRIRTSLAMNLYFDRDWEAAIRQAEFVLELEPDNAEAWYWIALARARLGDYERASLAAERAHAIDPDTPYMAAARAYPPAMSGDQATARAMLASAEDESWPLQEVAIIYGWLGELDTAFEYMDRAIVERPAALHYVTYDPSADPLRQDPRWASVVERLRSE